MPRRSLLLCISLLTATTALAQIGTGSIQGTVKDPTGAVVPGADVAVIHVQTSRQHDTVTNPAGFFILPSLQPGAYRVSVEMAGMQRWEGGLTLQVGQAAVVEPQLKLASATTEITVVGDVTPLVTTTNPTLGNTVERARIEQLPLNGRFFQTIVQQTTPGIEGASSSPKVYGLRPTSMEFVQDGAVLTNRDTGDLAGRPPGLDTID